MSEPEEQAQVCPRLTSCPDIAGYSPCHHRPLFHWSTDIYADCKMYGSGHEYVQEPAQKKVSQYPLVSGR